MAGPGKIKNSGPRAGFSLLEALVALTILLIGVAGMAASFQYYIFQSVAAKNQFHAARIAETVRAELESTDPLVWELDDINNNYGFDFEGERLPEGSSETPYYTVDVTSTSEAGWYQVTIGINWIGWQVEESKMAVGNESDTFAYVLEVSLSPIYGEESSEE